MELQGEPDRLEALFHIAQYGTTITSTHIETYINAARDSIVSYQVGSRQDAHIGHVPQAHLAAVGCVDEQVANTGQAVARLGRAQHHYIVHFLVPVYVAALNARYKCGRRA